VVTRVQKFFCIFNAAEKFKNMKIEKAIQQEKFESEGHKTHINILYTASYLQAKVNEALKPFNISAQQFNILRILRGRHPEPSSVKLLTARMLDKMSNASRLVEKLRKKGLLDRIENKIDRRKVDIIITEKGLLTVEEASHVVKKNLDKTFNDIPNSALEETNKVLDKLRSEP